MVTSRLLISKSSSSCTSPLMTVLSAPITIGIIITFMFYSVCNSLLSSGYLSLFLLYFSFIMWSAGTAKSTIQQVHFFCWLSLGLVVRPRLGELFLSQNPKEFCASHFLGRILGCVHTVCLYGQIQISYTIPSGLPSPPSVLSSLIRSLC